MKNAINEKRLLYRLFGFPIWTEDHDGAVRKRRALRLPNGDIVTNNICCKVIGYSDGSFHTLSYVVKWYHRETLWG